MTEDSGPGCRRLDSEFPSFERELAKLDAQLRKLAFVAEHPVRARIVELLKERPLTRAQLAGSITTSRSTVDRNVRSLLEIGAIAASGNGRAFTAVIS